MPLLKDKYKAPFWYINNHIATIVPNKLRRISGVSYVRERIELADGDFVDLDFSSVNSNSLVIILHGLEGNSERAYARALVRSVNKYGWDAVVFNQRSCSGEMNRLYSSYHSGKSDDLKEVLGAIETNKDYDSIYLVGYSLGGNITLKYLGEESRAVPSIVKKAVTISVPVDLAASAHELAKPGNKIYMRRFLKSLKAKTLEKLSRFPDSEIEEAQVLRCRSFIDYDNLYTAPAHGFRDAAEYWSQCSSKPLLTQIAIPTLLINSLDDPFLSPSCHPVDEARLSEYFFFMQTKKGGHVGFAETFPLSTEQFVERTVLEFLEN